MIGPASVSRVVRHKMKIILPIGLFITGGALAASAARPEFELVSDAAGGNLSWTGHTVLVCPNAQPPKDDSVLEDAKEGVYDIGLCWNTQPDTKTRDMLVAQYFWRIPKGDLLESRYLISVERLSTDEIVFTLRLERGGKVIRKSPVCRLEKGFSGTFEELAKSNHGHRLTTKLLDPEKRETPNQAAQSTTSAVTPPAGQKARQP
jgi:hypothetical protein